MKFKRKLEYAMYACLAVILIIPLVYWYNFPELTEMQVIVEYWYIYPMIVGAGVLLIMLGGEKKQKK